MQIGRIANSSLCLKVSNPTDDIAIMRSPDNDRTKAQPFGPADWIDRAHRLEARVASLVDESNVKRLWQRGRDHTDIVTKAAR